MRLNIKALIVGFACVIILGIFYFVLSQQEMPLWMQQYTFYAFMTALFGFVFGILALFIRKLVEEREIRKLEETKALESLRTEYLRCAQFIKDNAEAYVKKNETANVTAKLYEGNIFGKKPKIFEEVQEQIQELNEKCRLYNILARVSNRFILETMKHEVARKFSKTLKKNYELDELLCTDFTMPRYFSGEKVTESWFNENHPVAFKNIVKEIEESERNELPVLFNELNKIFQNDDVLQRFRKEKEEVLKCCNQITASLQKEIDSINEQLKKYSSLRMRERIQSDHSLTPRQ